MTPADNEYFDVIIVGAGLSGIGAACMLRRQCPDKRVLIVEARDCIGGTWDLFRYPGVRSDSDMHTLGYVFKPWQAPEAIADGPSILAYVEEAAREYGVDSDICFGTRVQQANWDSAASEWTLTVAGANGDMTVRCNMLSLCAGYYRYARGYDPDFPDRENFTGEIIHPQHWPQDFDYRGKQLVVIGSGATAVTLVPELAKSAKSVVMLQRSPTYVVSRPSRDLIGNLLRKILPAKLAYRLTRSKNTLLHQYFYGLTRTSPGRVKQALIKQVSKQLGPDYDVEKHFTPRYNPWDQRVCLVPDGDFFAAIKSGRAAVVTDEIVRFTAGGIALKSGAEVPADVIVTATGLELEVAGGIEFSVDDVPLDFSKTYTYMGMMHSGVPNLMSTFGYINSSWTLRADMNAEFLCRLIRHMDKAGLRQCMPKFMQPGAMPARPWIDGFTPGYLQRSVHKMSRQGDREPWINPQSYRRDRKMLLQSPLEDGVLQFS